MAKLEIASIINQSNYMKNINMKKQGSIRAHHQRTQSKPQQQQQQQQSGEFDEDESLITSSLLITSSKTDSSVNNITTTSTNMSQSSIEYNNMISSSTSTSTTTITTNDNDNDINNLNEKSISTSTVSCHSDGAGSGVIMHQRNRTNNKLKLLVRSQAIRESTSPPRDPQQNNGTAQRISPTDLNNTEISSSAACCTTMTGDKMQQHHHSEDDDREECCMDCLPQHNSRTSNGGCLIPTEINIEAIPPSIQAANCDDDDHPIQPTSPISNTTSSTLPSNNNNIKHSSNNRQKLEYSTITVACQKCNSEQHQQSHCCGNCANNNHLTNNNNNNTLSVSRANKNRMKNQQHSSSSFESSSLSPCLSRESSTEQYTDTTGINLGQFILETLNRNTKDRMLMLKIEQELVTLAKDKSKSYFKFPPMSSYQRMLVHRCAAFFGMDHNIESSGKCVIVNKTKSTRLPDIKFREHIRDDLLFPEEPRRSILKRDSNSFEECFISNSKSPDRQMISLENRRSKSFEEREEEYEKVRRRIFNREQMHDCSSQEELRWSEIPWSSSDSDNSSRMRLHPPSDHQTYRPTRLLKGQSVETRDTLRPCVSKSFSFGGYTGSVSLLARGDSVTSTHSAGARLLTKQDSAASSSMSWRLSPSSSGYKSQSQRSDSITPSPTATPFPSGHQNNNNNIGDDNNQAAMSWEEPSSPSSQGPPVVTVGQQQTPQQTQPQSTTVSTPPTSTTTTVNENNSPQPQESNNGSGSGNGGSNNFVWTTYSQNQSSSRRQQMIVTSSVNYNHNQVDDGQKQGPRSSADTTQTPIMWAITDLNKVPKGSYIINSETGAPFKNPDGTDYTFDLNNMHPALVLMVNSSQQQHVPNNTDKPAVVQQQLPAHNNKSDNQKSNYHSGGGGKSIYRNNSRQQTPPTSGGKNFTIKQNSPPITPAANKEKKSPTKVNNVSQSNGANKFDSDTQSPKKQTKYQSKSAVTTSTSTKISNTKSNFTTTATSPSLPFTPPMQQQQHAAAAVAAATAAAAAQYTPGGNGMQTPGAAAAAAPSYQYLPNNQYENVSNLPIQSFPVNYHTNAPAANVFGSSTMVPIHNSGAMQMYGDESSVVYTYGVPQYTRMDSSVSELSGYFVNMNLNNETPTNTTQQITYQSATPYWNHQPMVCYVPPQNSQTTQRYSVPLVQGQTGQYISATYAAPPAGSGPYPPTPTATHSAAPQTNTELVPLYPTGPPPPPIVYSHQMVPNGGNVPLATNHPPPTHGSIVYATSNPPPPPNTIMYAAPSGTQMYTPNIMYSNNNQSGTNSVNYPATNTPNSTYSTNSTGFTPQSSTASQQQYNPTTTTTASNDKRSHKYSNSSNSNSSTSTGGGKNGRNNNHQSYSTQSSNSSNSPASTVIQTYYSSNQQTYASNAGGNNNTQYNRHYSPSETPPNQTSLPPQPNMGYAYHQFQQNYSQMPPPHILPPQSTMIYRNSVPMGIRASPPINSRTSRSPTPSAEHYDRNTRYSMAPHSFQNVSCIVPGDLRFMSPRQQTPPYRNAYNRPIAFSQSVNDTNMGRPPKIKKTRTKPTPPLPPSGR